MEEIKTQVDCERDVKGIQQSTSFYFCHSRGHFSYILLVYFFNPGAPRRGSGPPCPLLGLPVDKEIGQFQLCALMRHFLETQHHYLQLQLGSCVKFISVLIVP